MFWLYMSEYIILEFYVLVVSCVGLVFFKGYYLYSWFYLKVK